MTKEKKAKILKQLKGLGITIIVFLPLFILLYQYTFDEKIFTGGDNAAYYALGKSLVNDLEYTNFHMAGATPANHFPPGYPALIAIHMFFFGYGIIGVKLLNGFFLFGSIILSYYIVKAISSSKPMAIVTALFVMFNTHYLYYGSVMMSEIPFVFFFLLGLLILLKTGLDKPFYKNGMLISLILVIVGLIYIRTFGIAFWGGVVCYFLLRKKIIYATVSFFAVLILLIPWQIRSYNLGGNGYMKSLVSKNPYSKEKGTVDFMDVMERVGNNAQRYVTKEIPNSILPAFEVNYRNEEGIYHGAGVGSWIFGLILVSLITLGLIKASNRGIHFLIGTTLIFSFIILLLWPDIWYGIRFIMPLVPLLLYLSIQGFLFLTQKILSSVFKAKTLPNWTPFILLFGIFYLQPSLKMQNKISKSAYALTFRHYFDISEWCKGLPDDAIIACRKPHLFYLKSEKTVTRFLYTDNVEEQMEFFKERKVTHVVLDQLGYSQTGKYLAPFLNAYSGKFIKIKETTKPVTRLFVYNDTLGYFGERVDGLRSGMGKFIWPEGVVYNGMWEDNKRNGYGKLFSPDGRQIKVNWKDDKQHGPGIVMMKDSTYVKINYNMGVPDSIGEFYSKEGEFLNYFYNKKRSTNQ